MGSEVGQNFQNHLNPFQTLPFIPTRRNRECMRRRNDRFVSRRSLSSNVGFVCLEKKQSVHLAEMSEPSGDKLILRGLMFHGYHGVKEEEKKLGQKFLIDVDAWMDLQPAGRSDNLRDTVSYTAIYRIVKEVVEGPSRNLLESVAEHVTMTTLTKFPQISAVRVKVGKPHVAVQGCLDYLGVEIVRNRSSLASQTQ